MSHQSKPGSQFEQQVEARYRELGARDIKRNVNMDGHEVDVYALVPSGDGTSIKTIVSCKDLSRPAGVDVVREWFQVLLPLRNAGLADVAVIVSALGFTQDAHAAATSMGIKLLSYDQLRWAGCDFRPHIQRMRELFSQEPVFKHGLYVESTITAEGTASETPAAKAIHEFLSLPNSRLLTILADYGGGKTTLCHKLFLDMAEAYEADPIHNRVPIYVNLRHYARHLNLQGFLVDYLVNEQGSRCPNFATLSDMSEEGRILFILDGFDEMSSRIDYATVLHNFDEIARLFGNASKLLLTCRTHFFISQEQAKEVHEASELYSRAKRRRYQFAFLNPFKWEQIEQYIKAARGNDWERDIRYIRETYDLASLAKRPILLHMITDTLPELIKQGKPINSTELYCLYTQKWLKRDAWRTALRYEDRLNFTVVFAEQMYNSGQNTFTWAELVSAIRRRWSGATATELQQYENDIRTCSFIIRSHRDDSYSFVHQSFTEYWVAIRLYESSLLSRICGPAPAPAGGQAGDIRPLPSPETSGSRTLF